MNCEAVADVCRAQPALIPADPRYVSVEELLETYDGFILTGGEASDYTAAEPRMEIPIAAPGASDGTRAGLYYQQSGRSPINTEDTGAFQVEDGRGDLLLR